MSFEIYGPDPTVLDISGRKPHVLIIGAGVAGLTLAIMLQEADIPFDIFEKSPEARAVGTALYLAPQVHPILEDLGIFESYFQHSNPCKFIHFFNQDRQPDFQLDFQLYKDLTGSDGRIIPHAALHALLLSRLLPSSSHKIHTSKRLLWYTQGENGVQVKFSDGTTFDGDILVGADGPTSAVRQCLYEYLKKAKKLPRGDARAVQEGREAGMADVGGGGSKKGGKNGRGKSVFLVGQTEKLDREVFFGRERVVKGGEEEKERRQEEEEECWFHNTRSNDQPYSWNTMTCKDGTICWSIAQHHSPSSSSSSSFSSFSTTSSTQPLDWSSDGVAVESISAQIHAFPIPSPFPSSSFTSSSNDSNNDNSNNNNNNNNDSKIMKMTLGDLIDRTPREQMTKVVVEERMFETWSYCRTILIGDACHKLHPIGNQGAHLALQDAHNLALQISSLSSTQLKPLTRALKAYKSVRQPATQRAWLLARALANLNVKRTGGGLVGKCVRKLPPWAWRKVFERLVGTPSSSLLSANAIAVTVTAADGGGGGGRDGRKVDTVAKPSLSMLSLNMNIGDEDDDEKEKEEKVTKEAVAALRKNLTM